MQLRHARVTVSISELKKNPSGIIDQSRGEVIAILNRNRPTAYLIPAAAYEQLVERLADVDLAQLVRDRQAEASVEVNLDEI